MNVLIAHCCLYGHNLRLADAAGESAASVPDVETTWRTAAGTVKLRGQG